MCGVNGTDCIMKGFSWSGPAMIAGFMFNA